MKNAVRRNGKAQGGLEDEYCSSLREYAAGRGEPALRRAYELGRLALAERKSLVEIASLHHQAVLALVRGAKSEKRRDELFQAGAQFYAGGLLPHGMGHPGVY